jgi:prepilin peptidase CpaA
LLKISDPVVVSLVTAGGGAGAAVDLKVRRVPNVLTAGLALTGLALALFHVTTLGIASALLGGLCGLLLLLPGHVIGATGAGDVKLFAAMGTLLGPAGILSAFIYTAVAGGLLALLVALGRRRLRVTVERAAALVSGGGANVAEIERPTEDNRFAYAPAIAVGALIAALGF